MVDVSMRLGISYTECHRLSPAMSELISCGRRSHICHVRNVRVVALLYLGLKVSLEHYSRDFSADRFLGERYVDAKVESDPP